MPSGLFYLNSLDQSIFSLRVVWSVLIITMFFEMPIVNANNVDPDQTPRSVASDLGLRCLPMSHLWDAMHKWVNIVRFAHCRNFTEWHIYSEITTILSSLFNYSAFP